MGLSRAEKKKLKKIYNVEFQKAYAEEKVTAYEAEVASLKVQAQKDAKRKASRVHKPKVTQVKVTAAKLKKKSKPARKKLSQIGKNIDKMNKEYFNV